MSGGREFLEVEKPLRSALDEEAACDLVLGILWADLDAIRGRYVAKHRQHAAAERLRCFSGDLGYVG